MKYVQRFSGLVLTPMSLVVRPVMTFAKTSVSADHFFFWFPSLTKKRGWNEVVVNSA